MQDRERYKSESSIDFLMAIVQGNKKLVETYIKNSAKLKLNMNDIDLVSGRTFLHYAIEKNQHEIAQLLFQAGVDPLIRDKEGFDSYELLVNPHPYRFDMDDPDIQKTKQYQEFLIEEENKKLKDAKIVFITQVEEINPYLEKNPTLSKIGFIVTRPNASKVTTIVDVHVIPIYYERKNNTENFVQLDSGRAELALIPSTSQKEVKRRHFYLSFSRQVAKLGCFEDSITLFRKLFNANNFIEFCEKNSTEDKAISKPLTTTDITLGRGLENKDLNFQQTNMKWGLNRREVYSRQMEVLNAHKLTFSDPLFSLNLLPGFLLCHVERFDTMRHLRTKHSALFTEEKEQKVNHLDHILKIGKIRNSSTSKEAITSNIKNESADYDFNGYDIQKRHEVFTLFYETRNKAVAPLIKSKLENENSKQKKPTSEKKLDIVADTISSFMRNKK